MLIKFCSCKSKPNSRTMFTILNLLQNILIVKEIFDYIDIEELFTKRFTCQQFYQTIRFYIKSKKKNSYPNSFFKMITYDEDKQLHKHCCCYDGAYRLNEINQMQLVFEKNNKHSSYSKTILDYHLELKYKNSSINNEFHSDNFDHNYNLSVATINYALNYLLDDETLNNRCQCLATFEMLENLYLDYCWNVTNQTLANIFHQCRRIKKLSLSNIYSVEDDLLNIIGEHLELLEWINLKCCWRITDNGIW